jgi:hypothetical protein
MNAGEAPYSRARAHVLGSRRFQTVSLTEEAFRAAFSPGQADLLLAALALKPEEHLSAREASAAIGWTYDTFRKESAFDAANVAPQGRRKRYARSTLARIAENLRAGSKSSLTNRSV